MFEFRDCVLRENCQGVLEESTYVTQTTAKDELLDRVKVKQVPERPPPLPPLVPNIVSMGYPALPMPGENGMKQHCQIVDIKIMDENADDRVVGKRERPKWTGIEDIMLAYSEYSKGTRHLPTSLSSGHTDLDES